MEVNNEETTRKRKIHRDSKTGYIKTNILKKKNCIKNISSIRLLFKGVKKKTDSFRNKEKVKTFVSK